MQIVKYFEMPKSFDLDMPMSKQLRIERDKLFNNIYTNNYPDNDILKHACKFLKTNIIQLTLIKSTKYTGRNYDLFAIVYYLKTRKKYTIAYMSKYIFTNRNLKNYLRDSNIYLKDIKYINLFNYLDTINEIKSTTNCR